MTEFEIGDWVFIVDISRSSAEENGELDVSGTDAQLVRGSCRRSRLQKSDSEIYVY